MPLSKEFDFEDCDVEIKNNRVNVVLNPAATTWDSLLDSLSQFTEDFMAERLQPPESMSHNSKEPS